MCSSWGWHTLVLLLEVEVAASLFLDVCVVFLLRCDCGFLLTVD